MKGLMIKDLLLLKNQAKFIGLLVIIALIMIVSGVNVIYINAYFSFFCATLVVNTISYDEYDHGYGYLFCLPMTRSGYVFEKYVLGLLLGMGSWLVSGVVATLFFYTQKEPVQLEEIWIPFFLNLVTIIIYLSFFIAIRIKFGNEKGRIFTFVLMGIIVCVFALTQTTTSNPIIQEKTNLSLNQNIFLLLGAGLLALGMFVGSYYLSVHIMKKKEF